MKLYTIKDTKRIPTTKYKIFSVLVLCTQVNMMLVMLL
jgi:hypothetical protein